MSCEKHKIRKRSNCPDCISELNNNTLVEKTQEDTDKIIVTSTPIGESEFYKVYNESLIKEKLEQMFLEFESKVDEYFDKKLLKFKQEINKLANVRWEYKWIPEGSFKISMIDKEAKNGWKFKDVFRGEILKAYGLKEASVLFERIVP